MDNDLEEYATWRPLDAARPAGRR